MRAIRLKSPAGLDNLTVGTAEIGAVGPHDIRVRLHASSLNYHDYIVALGGIPTPDGRIPMSDGAGEVTEIGSKVHEFAVGDRVVSTFFPLWLAGPPTLADLAEVPGDRTDGYARDEVVAAATAFTHAPQGYGHAEAATLTCAAVTAWRALFVEASLQPGETVLVQGTGGVSIFALQFAKAAGATVIATSSSQAKLDKLAALGADHLINYKTTADWGAAARTWTGGRGVDHVVEIGGAGTLNQSIVATRLGGHIALIGVLAGFAGSVNTAAIMGNQIRLQGLFVGSREHQLDMIRSINVSGIKPVIDCSFPLEGLGDAFRKQESGTHFGKICLEF